MPQAEIAWRMAPGVATLLFGKPNGKYGVMRRTSRSFSAAQAKGAIMALTPVQLRRAVRSNSIYARRLKWLERYQQISQVLGFSNISPGAEAFAQALADWQRANPPLTPDGMLGPKTWRKLEPRTRFSPGYGRSAPDWLSRPPPPDEVDDTEGVSTNIWFGISVDFGGTSPSPAQTPCMDGCTLWTAG